MRNCKIGDSGALALSTLIDSNKSIQELEIFNCGITFTGGNAIGNALKTNFRMQKLSIGENNMDKKDVEQIQQSVIFNTQYNQMKDNNSKFDGFAPMLIAESLKKWASHTKFVRDKLIERLSQPEDDLDRRIAEIINAQDEEGEEKDKKKKKKKHGHGHSRSRSNSPARSRPGSAQSKRHNHAPK